MLNKMFIGLLMFIAFTTPVSGEIVLRTDSDGMKLEIEKLSDNLDIPWGLAFVSPTQIIFTEISGKIYLFDTTTKSKTFLYSVNSVLDSGQGGLLDVAVSKKYTNGDWIYFTYSKDSRGKGLTTLARARLEGNRLTSWQDLLVTKSETSSGRHFGSRIAFDEKGHLFFSVGDRGHRPNGQDLETHAGSILRLKIDGSVPTDNPFVGNQKALPEIWSFGHRNPQGIAYDTEKGRLWAIEHGPRGGDEINLIQSGKNYGWPVVSYGKEYWGPIQVGEGTEKEGMEQPIKVYIPSIAPGSLVFYTGDAFPKWKGDLLTGALKLTHLNRVRLDSAGKVIGEERLLEDLDERIRALVQGPEGWIYFSTDSGKILRIRPG